MKFVTPLGQKEVNTDSDFHEEKNNVGPGTFINLLSYECLRHLEVGNIIQKNYGRISAVLVTLFAIFVLSTSIQAAQLPVPADAISYIGSPSWSQQSSDLIGDRGDWGRASMADLDADGDYDLLVAGGSPGTVEYWRNDGNNTSPTFVLANNNLLGVNIPYASPTVTDYDKDGDLDILIGADDGYLRYMENVGTATSPSYVYTRALFDGGTRTSPAFFDYNNDGYQDILYGDTSANIYKMRNDVANTGLFFDDAVIDDLGTYSAPAFADIDADGDQDLFVGEHTTSKVYFIENDGTPTQAVWLEKVVAVTASAALPQPVLGDWDGDQDLDMLVGKTDGTLDYFRNDGSKFAPVWTKVSGIFDSIDVGTNAAPAVADLDKDGDIDLAVSSDAGGTNYYRNDGNKTSPVLTFQGLLVGDVGTTVRPAFADMDGDGDIDLALGESVGYVFYYENTGTATNFTFTQRGNFLNDTFDYPSPAIADVNGDGKKDMYTGTEGGWIVDYLNQGSSTVPAFFQQRSYWQDNFGRYRNIDHVDFDKDGDLDMVVGDENGLVYYYRNDGDAVRPQWTFVRDWIGDWGTRTSATIVDYDNDGRLDMILGRADDTVLRWFKNDVAASSVNWTIKTADLIGDQGTRTFVESGDINGDGLLDLLVGESNGRVRYYRNNGTATNPSWTLVTSDLVGSVGGYSSPILGDMDADGDLDLIVGTSSDSRLRYFDNQGNSTNYNFVLTDSDWLNDNCIPGDGSPYCRGELVDIDADGDLDLMVNNYYRGVYLWRNDGTTQIPIMNPIGFPIGDPEDWLKADFADFDNDGDQDMVVGTSSGLNFYYKNIGTAQAYNFVFVYAGNGGSDWTGNTVNGYSAPDVADYNNDSNFDIIRGRDDGFVTHLANNGIYQGTKAQADFVTWIHWDGSILKNNCRPGDGNAYCSAEFADLDNDGDLDLVASNYYCARYWRNDGSKEVPLYTDGGDISCTNGHADVALGDMDNDSDADLMVTQYTGQVYYYRNIGTTGPVWQYVYGGAGGDHFVPATGGYLKIDIADLNNDSLNDVIVTNDAFDYTVIRNRGLYTSERDRGRNPTWVSEGVMLTTPSTHGYGAPTLADMDGDGDLDIVLGNQCRLTYHENTGTLGSPSFTYLFDIINACSFYYGPGVADLDGDKDADIVIGDVNGFFRYYKETLPYTRGTGVRIKNATGGAVAGIAVTFADNSGTVCTNVTDSKGFTSCSISWVGNKGSISVSAGPAGGSMSLAIVPVGGNGVSFPTLKTPLTNYSVKIERLGAAVFDTSTKPAQLKVELYDQGLQVGRGFTDAAGALDMFLPQKYLENKQEQFTQNRVTYDAVFSSSPAYVNQLRLNDVYVPNQLNASAGTDSKKLFKLLSSRELSTDSQYKVYSVFPVSKAQYNFQISDSIPQEFNFTGTATLSYGLKSCSVAVSGKTLSITPATPGCDFLTKPSKSVGDWFTLQYTVLSPSLDLFIKNGWTSQSFLFPAPVLTLNA